MDEGVRFGQGRGAQLSSDDSNGPMGWAEPIGWQLHGTNHRTDSNGCGGLAPMNCETVGSLGKMMPPSTTVGL